MKYIVGGMLTVGLSVLFGSFSSKGYVLCNFEFSTC